jgi:hypothetical protein
VDALNTWPNTGGHGELEEVLLMIDAAEARSNAESSAGCLRPSFATKYTAALGNDVLLHAELGLLELGGADGDCEAELGAAGLAALAGFRRLEGEVGNSKLGDAKFAGKEGELGFNVKAGFE